MNEALRPRFYRPNVRFGEPDYSFCFGEYTLRLYSSQLYHTGLIDYLHLLKVTNTLGEYVLYVSAEVNAIRSRSSYCLMLGANGAASSLVD